MTGGAPSQLRNAFTAPGLSIRAGGTPPVPALTARFSSGRSYAPPQMGKRHHKLAFIPARNEQHNPPDELAELRRDIPHRRK